MFEFRVTTHSELWSCPHYDMTNDLEWNQRALDLRSLPNISQVKKGSRTVHNAKRNTAYTFQSSLPNYTHFVFEYLDPSSDEAILTEISPLLVQLN